MLRVENQSRTGRVGVGDGVGIAEGEGVWLGLGDGLGAEEDVGEGLDCGATAAEFSFFTNTPLLQTNFPDFLIHVY